jgi:hypothetical protein
MIKIMKINYKYVVAGILLATAIILAVVWISGANQNNNDQDIFDNQLGKCQEISPSYIGLSEQDAIDKADNESRSYRIVMRDGEEFFVTMDYSPSRLNFEVNDGLITEVNCG